jgi:hypothetical protein
LAFISLFYQEVIIFQLYNDRINIRDELMEAFFAAVSLVSGMRVATEFPEVPVPATRADESRC